MTLTYNTTVLGGTPINDACDRSFYSEIVILQGSSCKRVDALTGAQNGASITCSALDCVTLITNDKAISMSTSSTTSQEIDLVGGTATNRTSLDFCPYGARTQQVAGDISNSIAIGLGYSPEKIVKFSVGSASLLTRRWCVNANSNRNTCIINIGPNRFVVGTVDGRIIEIDQDAEVVRSYTLPRPKSWHTATTALLQTMEVISMHYAYGFLAVSLYNGWVYILNHETGELTQKFRPYCIGPAVLSQEGSLNGVEVLLGCNQSNSNTDVVFGEVDMFLTPLRFTGYAHNLVADACSVCGYANSGTVAWFCTNGVSLWDVGGTRTVVTDTYEVSDGQGRVTIIDDTGGSGTGTVLLDSPLPAGGQVLPLTDGLDLINSFQYQDGTHAKYQITRSST